ncbi:MAG: hypothetical protein KF774_04270 [Planctomyces sp.]|nr:hypothetical protein [Planctomyces sp.]
MTVTETILSGVPASVPSPTLSRGERLLVAALALISILPIWAAEWFPSQNGPWFLLPTHMFLHYDDPRWDYQEHFVRVWQPIPHMLHDILVGLAALAVPLQTAEKLVLTLNALLLPASVFAVLSVAAPQRQILGLLAFPMMLSYPFFRGYHDFTLSIPLFFFSLTMWWKTRTTWNAGHLVGLLALTTLTWLSHLFTFALLAGCIGWLELWNSGRLGRACLTTLSVTWPGWLLTANYIRLSSGATWVRPSDTSWLPLHWTVENFIRQYFHSISTPAYVLAVLAWIWLAVLAIRGWRASGKSIASAVRSTLGSPLGSLVVFLAVAYLVLPDKLIGWHKVNIRLTPFILGLALAAVASLPALSLTRRWRRTFITTVSMLTIGISTCLTPEVRAMGAVIQEYRSGIPHLPQGARVLVVHSANPRFGQVRPVTRAHEHYHIERGGANLYSLPALNTLSIMWYRQYPVENRLPRWDSRSGRFSAELQQAYDAVLMFGAPDELATLVVNSGFDAVHRQGRLALYLKTRPNELRAALEPELLPVAVDEQHELPAFQQPTID